MCSSDLKAAALDIKTICPLHGPVLTGDLGKYLNYYVMMTMTIGAVIEATKSGNW